MKKLVFSIASYRLLGPYFMHLVLCGRTRTSDPNRSAFLPAARPRPSVRLFGRSATAAAARQSHRFRRHIIIITARHHLTSRPAGRPCGWIARSSISSLFLPPISSMRAPVRIERREGVIYTYVTRRNLKSLQNILI